MKVTQIQVEFEKRVNDGDYGSDRVQLRLSADVDEGEDADELVSALLHQVRQRVTLDLRNSVTLAVRRRMNPKPRLCDECKQILSDDDDYEHEACGQVRRERERVAAEERQARYAAEAEERRARYAAEQAAHAQSDDDDDVPDGHSDDDDEPM